MGRGGGWRLLAAALVLSGCATLKDVSAGYVGCPPNEVKISDVHTPLIGAQTWTATCRGVVHYCSSIKSETILHDGDSDAPPNVSCTEAKPTEEDDYQASSPPPSSPPSRQQAAQQVSATSQQVEAPLPTEALGYQFDMSVEAAQNACTQASHLWDQVEDGYHCSGVPEDIGLPMESYLKFCGEKLCDLTGMVMFDPKVEEANEQFQQIFDALRKRYGSPTTNRANVPEDCKKRFVHCVAVGKASWQAEWRWNTGERIVARIDPKKAAARFAARYVLGTAGSIDSGAF